MSRFLKKTVEVKTEKSSRERAVSHDLDGSSRSGGRYSPTASFDSIATGSVASPLTVRTSPGSSHAGTPVTGIGNETSTDGRTTDTPLSTTTSAISAPASPQSFLAQGPAELTPMMKSLNEIAKQKAREIIERKFRDPMDLEDLTLLSGQLQKQVMVAESQLNGSVQSKLEALKRAADLMDATSSQLSALSKTVNMIDERIHASNTSISNYPYLRRVHNVRDNIGKVLSQIDFFAHVPERVRALKELVENEPQRLKEVFLESLKLESLRKELLAQIKVSRTRRSSVITMLGTNHNHQAQAAGPGPGPPSKSDFSAETGARVKEAVENHLHIVPDLARHIHQKVMGIIDNMSEVAETTPQDLVAAFEVIEMQTEYQERRRTRAHELGLPEPSDYEPWLDVVRERIKGVLGARVQHILDRARTGAAERNMTLVAALLAGATEVLSTISLFKMEVVPCVPPHYKILEVFLQQFEQQWSPGIKKVCNGDNVLALGPSELLQLVDWFEFFEVQISTYGINAENDDASNGREQREPQQNVPFSNNQNTPSAHGSGKPAVLACQADFQRLSEDLMAEYLDRIKHQVVQWFNNIKKLPLEPRQNTDGTVITTNPEEMFRCLHLQIEVAKEKLPREKLKDVIMACLQVLRQIQRDTYDALSQGYQLLSPQLMCACINDNQRMQETCDEVFGEIIEMVPQEDERDMLGSVLEDVSNEYVQIAVRAAGLLARSLLQCDLAEPFDALFSQDWENGDPVCEAISSTLYECFRDLEEWLPEFFFSRVAYNSLTYAVDFYISALIRNCSTPPSSDGKGKNAGGAAAVHMGVGVAAESSPALATPAASEAATSTGLGIKSGVSSLIAPLKSAIPAMTTKTNYKFRNELIVANQISQDLDSLLQFFQSYSVVLHRGGLARDREVVNELAPLANVMNIVRAPHFSAAEKDATELYQKYGKDGLHVVLCIVAASPSLSKTEKADYERGAKQLFASIKDGGAGDSGSGNNGSKAAKGGNAAKGAQAPKLNNMSIINTATGGSATSGWGWFKRS